MQQRPGSPLQVACIQHWQCILGLGEDVFFVISAARCIFILWSALIVSISNTILWVKAMSVELCANAEAKESSKAAEGQALSLLKFAWGYIFETPTGSLHFMDIR